MVAGVLIADLSTKAWAARQAQESGTSELVGPVRVKLSHNAGASFGLGAQRPVLTLLVSLAVTAGCLGWLTMARCAAERLAVGAVVGGALGNLADRVAHGAVTDWLHVTGYPPTFNLADLAVRLGALTAVVLRSRARRR